MFLLIDNVNVSNKPRFQHFLPQKRSPMFSVKKFTEIAEVYNYEIKKLWSIFREVYQVPFNTLIRNTKFREILVFSYFVAAYVKKIRD